MHFCVKYNYKITKKFKLNFGFHAHNNLGCAVYNSIEALNAGATILDASMRGFGAGAGNTQLEVLLTILKNKKLIPEFLLRGKNGIFILYSI